MLAISPAGIKSKQTIYKKNVSKAVQLSQIIQHGGQYKKNNRVSEVTAEKGKTWGMETNGWINFGKYVFAVERKAVLERVVHRT